MGSLITNFLQNLTPPPYINPLQYDGWEYKYRFLVFRPALLKNEAFFILGVLVYVAFILWGKSNNSKRANKWFDAHLPIFEQQFSSPTNDGLTQDGSSDFFNFSTGRRGLVSLHTIFTLRPRHDLAQYAFQILRTFIDLQYRPMDEIQLDFKLIPGSIPDFVWAVVAKDELLSIKEGRWDLTFTKTTENPALPPTLSVMSEFADVTENLLKPTDKFSLVKFLSDPAIQPYFRSLSITDQPRERPSNGPIPAAERQKHVILSLSSPSPSHAADTTALVTAVFAFIDSLSRINLRPETKVKIKKTREELDKDLKEETVKEKNEEAVEDKKAAKRKAEEERVSRLSAAEQKKIIERERRRSMRKQQGKVVRK